MHMLDITSVRIVNGNKAAGFEELCVHLAEAICRESGQRKNCLSSEGDEMSILAAGG